MEQKIFYLKVVLQKVLEITVRSRQVGLRDLHEIPYILEDFWRISSHQLQIFQNVRNSTRNRCEAYPTSFGRNFEHFL